jgi:hypothetical protein
VDKWELIAGSASAQNVSENLLIISSSANAFGKRTLTISIALIPILPSKQYPLTPLSPEAQIIISKYLLPSVREQVLSNR